MATTELPQSTDPAHEQAGQEPNADGPHVEVFFDQQLGAIPVPSNIDPSIIDIWLEKEKKALFAEQLHEKSKGDVRERPLSTLFMVYIAVVGMIVAIILGIVNGSPAAEILDTAFRSLLCYGVIGFVIGLIAEHTVRESVETVVREVVRKSDEAGEHGIPDSHAGSPG